MSQSPKVRLGARWFDCSNYSGSVMLWYAKLRYRMRRVFILASDGGYWEYPGFMLLWQHARQRGMERGAIHYLRPNIAGRIQANHHLSVVHRAGGWGAYAKFIIDLENTMGQSTEAVLNCANEYALTLKSGGVDLKNVMLYSAHWFWNVLGNPTNIPEPLASLPQWLSLYDNPATAQPTSLPGMKSKVVAQQYAGSVKLLGVSHNVDLDVSLY